MGKEQEEEEMNLSVGKYLREKREASELSLRSVASRIGMSHVFLGKIENDLAALPIKWIDQLAFTVPEIDAGELEKLVRTCAHADVGFRPKCQEEYDLAVALKSAVATDFRLPSVEMLKSTTDALYEKVSLRSIRAKSKEVLIESIRNGAIIDDAPFHGTGLSSAFVESVMTMLEYDVPNDVVAEYAEKHLMMNS